MCIEESCSYLFVLFVNFNIIRYGDTVEQTTGTFSRLIRANVTRLLSHSLSGTGFAKIIGANQTGKRARSLFDCISVTDDIEINEQNKQVATGLLYVQPEFDAFSTLVRGEMRISNPRG